MSEISHEPSQEQPGNGERDLEYERLQNAICEYLVTEEVTQLSQVPPELTKDIQIHLSISGCGENHYPIAGLYLED